MYVYEEYPKWKYHPSKDAVVVQNAEEEAALGRDWFDRPDQAVDAMQKIKAALEQQAQASHDRT